MRTWSTSSPIKSAPRFRSLTTDEERTHFIEQFWLRRDPTPAQPENEFKEEHYRRIAYANEHFASRNLLGWKTDRGHIYINYGPPDEIESHPSGGQGTTVPFEEWLYQYIEGVGAQRHLSLYGPASQTGSTA